MPPKIEEEKVSLTRARRIVLGQFIYMDRRFQKYEGKVSERVVFILTPSPPWCHFKTINKSAKFETFNFVFFAHWHVKGSPSQRIAALKIDCYRTGKCSVCRHVCASFSPKFYRLEQWRGVVLGEFIYIETGSEGLRKVGLKRRSGRKRMEGLWKSAIKEKWSLVSELYGNMKGRFQKRWSDKKGRFQKRWSDKKGRFQKKWS